MSVDPRVATSFLHQGRIYYFRAESCRRTFVQSSRSVTGTPAADQAIE
jgi:YHS domain-containing protein